MLTLFPYLLDFQMIAPFLLRIALSLVLFTYCYKTVKKDKITLLRVWSLLPNNWMRGVIISQLIIAIMLTVGLYVQAVAILAIISLMVKDFTLKKQGEKCAESSFSILFIAACLSLLVLGPGIFSLDLPL